MNPFLDPQFKPVTRKLLMLHTTAAPSIDVVDELKLLNTDRERFTAVLDKVLQYDADVWFRRSCKQKDSERSNRLREDGNTSFKNGQHKEAVREYTESVVYAKDSSEDLAWGYANRSAALYKLEKYDDCIKDIDRALNLKIPDRSKTGLYKRKGLCQKALGIPDFESSLEEALVWLNKLGMSEEQMNKTRTKLKEECTSLPPATPQVNVVKYPVLEILSPCPEAPCASDAIAIKYSEKYGRHVVATRKIKPGELLILEKPYFSKLEDQNICTHCAHCLQESWSLIPCRCCVYATYCSEACKDEAWNRYHEVECRVTAYLVDYEFTSPLWISVNTIIMATQKGTKLDSLKEELQNIDSNPDPRTMGFSDDGKFLSDRYQSIYTLSSISDKCSLPDVLERSLWVALTVCVMARETNMFGKKIILDRSLTTNPHIIFVGGLILKSLFICYSNMFGYGSLNQDLSTDYAAGIVPVCSLLNHSCDTNTLRQWYVDRQAVYALLPLEKGDQIFDNYGARCCDMARFERRLLLENWGIICECPPCTHNWPTLWDMPSYKDKCASRKNKRKLDKIMRRLSSTGNDVLQNTSREKLIHMLNELSEAVEALTELAPKPCKELYTIIGVMQMFYWSSTAVFDYVPGESIVGLTSAPSEFYKRLKNLTSMLSK